VLVVSTKVDVATDTVLGILASRGVPFTRIDSEDFPYDSLLSTSIGGDNEPSILFQARGGSRVAIDTPTSVWYRRIRSPEPIPGQDPGVHDFCAREARAALVGAVLASGAPCMSPPANIWAAEHKVLQLEVARAAGLETPSTLITNDPEAITDAFRACGGSMIVKPTRTGYVEAAEGELAIFTSLLLEEHLEHIADARWSPAIYQPLVPKRCDVRVTIVGRRLFVAEIDSQTDESAAVDWRRTDNPDLPHRAGSVPAGVEARLLQLMDVLGLEFGAVDLVRTPDDRYVFLEVNPGGQWLWIDDKLDLGISTAVADWLVAPRG
jgi:glutathione synthase/RimK-type ligase-like ATP-grasp enzyme